MLSLCQSDALLPSLFDSFKRTIYFSQSNISIQLADQQANFERDGKKRYEAAKHYLGNHGYAASNLQSNWHEYSERCNSWPARI